MRVLIDTSAAMKLVLDESESRPLQAWLDQKQPELIGIELLETELRRVAIRFDVPQVEIDMVLSGIGLHDLAKRDYRAAGLLPGRYLRSLDALHLQGALKLDADGILTYDKRMAETAKSFGFKVFSPH